MRAGGEDGKMRSVEGELQVSPELRPLVLNSENFLTNVLSWKQNLSNVKHMKNTPSKGEFSPFITGVAFSRVLKWTF